MSVAIFVTLMMFAAVAFAGAGMALAVGRAREVSEAIPDVGMRAVSLLLFGFASICTFVAAGLAGVFAYGGVITWASYVYAAQRVGVFKLYSGDDHRRSDFLQRDPLGR